MSLGPERSYRRSKRWGCNHSIRNITGSHRILHWKHNDSLYASIKPSIFLVLLKTSQAAGGMTFFTPVIGAGCEEGLVFTPPYRCV
ncbi:hypothetical protein FKM82_020489 [Ascaphus truei]